MAEDRIATARRNNDDRLDLSYLDLTTLPESLGQLTTLTALNLRSNGLSVLPEWLGQLTNLTALNLSNNRLSVLPEWLGQLTNLTNLTNLDLSDNRLSVLPEWLGQLTNLTTLNLSDNKLSVLPEWLGQLTNLTRLDLRSNGLSVLPEWLGQLTNLTALDLDENGLSVLPEWLGQLTNLTTLNLGSNGLSVLPEWLGQLTNLTRLDIDDNGLSVLPEWLRQLTNLTTLYLSNNRLSVLPEWLGQLTNLTALYLSDNGLSVLPEWLGQLTNLTNLDLSNNGLSVLPEWLGQLTNLSDLDLSYNELSVLPESLGQLTNLSNLDLDNNELSVLPESLGQLTELVSLNLEANPDMSSPPPEVVGQSTQAVLAYLRALAESSVHLWQSKVLIVGEATVGKTSLAKALRGDDFDPDERQTHGIRIDQLHLPHPDQPGVVMDLDVWDFGGQLEYRATQRFYLTDRSLFLLVWNSRARAVDGKVVPWLDVVTARAPRSPIIVVATHGDEHSPAALRTDLASRYRQITAAHTVDSRTGTGIGELRQTILAQAAALPLMGMRWPTTWTAAAQAVRELPGLTATRNAVFKTMATAGLTDPAGHQAVAQVLHDLGHIVYFADQPDLAAKVILRPQWLDARITQVIDSATVAAADGVLSRTERHRLWNDLAEDENDPDLPDRLIRMMEAFDLAYRLGDQHDSQDVALIVDRLPEAPPDHADKTWRQHTATPGARQIGISYKLASRQAGIPTWFIAREHRYTTGLHWRTGAVLHDRDPHTPAWALISDDGREQPTVTIRVTGAYPVRFLSVLTEAFDNIIEDRYPGLVEQRLVPCVCPGTDRTGCTHAFDLDELMAEATDPDPDAHHLVRCPKTRKKIEAAVMLDGLRGTGLVAELEAVHQQLAAQDSTLNRIDAGQQVMLNGIRALLEDRANAGVHCPAVFSIRTIGQTRVLRRNRHVLSLWCEWPAGPHLLADGAGDYPIDTIPPALAHYLPYLRSLITILGIAAPGVLAAGLGDRTQAALEAATATMEFIDGYTGKQDSSVELLRPNIPAGPYRRTASGADFRALRDLLEHLEAEHPKNWGNLAPASRPEDRRIIYLCPKHLTELDFPYTATLPPPSAE